MGAGAGSRGLAWALALGAFAAASALRADPWYVHYENAERALAAQEWQRAVEEANAAIQRRGEPGVRVRSYGMKVVDYFPYLELGMALHGLGQDEAALQAFETEARLGAVLTSPAGRQRLEQARAGALAAREAARVAEAGRRRQILEQSLLEARDLDQRGLVDEAMAALAKGLAVEPDDAAAAALLADLRTRAAARRASADAEARAATQLAEARDRLARGEPEPAASLLRQVVAVRPTEEARALLERAQQAIAGQVAAGERHARVEAALAEARRDGAAGRTTAALERLEVALALEPGNADAVALRAGLAAAAETARRSGELQASVEAAESELAAGRYEAALGAANRVLAGERGNARALDVVRRAYVEISRRLLVGPASGNQPPAIRFANQRQDETGELVARVRDPDFELAGVAIDRSPVTLAFTDGAGRPLAATVVSQTLGETVVTEFRLRRRLEPGRSVVRARAADGDGASADAEFVVVYARPWFRAPWIPAAAAAVPAAALIAWELARRRRRRRLLRRRFNPYIAGGPVFAAEMFYGREALVRRILQTVHTNSLMLYGERRIGKTSLLHHVRRRLEALDDPEYRFHAVYVDLQGTPESKFFATVADQVWDGLDGVLAARARAPALARAAYDHHDLVRELHGVLEELQAASAKRVRLVLLLDEVDELNHYDPRVNQKLRSLFMKRFAERLVAVVAGVGIRKEWEREGSPWYNFFEEVEVRTLDAGDARALVLEPIRGVFRVADGVAERVVALSAGRPYLVQRHCLALVHRMHEQGRRTITLEDVAAVVERGGATP